MTFQESIVTCLKEKYFFCFQGRASRSEFWFFMLFICLVNILTGLIFALAPPTVAMIGTSLISLALLPANLGVTVRRFHDRNLSGWWLLLPIGALVFALLFGSGGPIASGFSLAMCVCYLAILSMPSQEGANRFGPAPQEAPGNL